MSVISSEMSAEAPIEFLKAHAITSRSWLVAMLERPKKFKTIHIRPQHSIETSDEIIRWHDREDHDSLMSAQMTIASVIKELQKLFQIL